MKCRDPKGLGYHKYQCPNDPEITCTAPHTCKTRICTSCATLQGDVWTEETKKRFPKGRYLHITFTIPEQLRVFFGPLLDRRWKRKSDLYALGWKVLDGWGNQKDLKLGGLEVIHTFGRALNTNPHLHVVLPAGGLYFQNPKGNPSWKKLDNLSRDYLAQAWKNNVLHYVFENTPVFSQYADKMIYWLKSKNSENYRKLVKLIQRIISDKDTQRMWQYVIDVEWYVGISKRSYHVYPLCYVARYAKKLPIAKSRITKFDPKKEIVVWAHTPHRTPNQPVLSTMHPHEFIAKLMDHIAPKNFRVIRYFGIFSTQKMKKYRPMIEDLCEFDIPEEIPPWHIRILRFTGKNPLICPHCNKTLQLVETAYPDNHSQKLKIKII